MHLQIFVLFLIELRYTKERRNGSSAFGKKVVDVWRGRELGVKLSIWLRWLRARLIRIIVLKTRIVEDFKSEVWK